MDIPKHASLLGLPRELRLQIYKHILPEDICYTIDTNEIRTIAASKPRPLLHRSQHYVVPWILLLLVCKAIGEEVRSFIETTSSLAHDQEINSRTYTMYLDLQKRRAGPLIWRQVPCAPKDARVLVATCVGDNHFHVWGDGG